MTVRQPQVEFEPLRMKIVMLLAYFQDVNMNSTCKIAKYIQERIGEGGGIPKRHFASYMLHIIVPVIIITPKMKSIMVIKSQLHEMLPPSTLLKIYSRK